MLTKETVETTHVVFKVLLKLRTKRQLKLLLDVRETETIQNNIVNVNNILIFKSKFRLVCSHPMTCSYDCLF